MRCWDFEIDVADYVRKRLPEDRRAAMNAHLEHCPKCRRVVALEETLQTGAARMEGPQLRRDLWPELATRIQTGPGLARHRSSWLLLRWATVGVVTAVMGAMAFRLAVRPDQQAMARPEDEARVVRMMTTVEPIQYVDADVLTRQEAQRVLLIGASEP